MADVFNANAMKNGRDGGKNNPPRALVFCCRENGEWKLYNHD